MAPLPEEPSWPTRTGPVEADGAVDAQNAPTAPWKTRSVFHELPQGFSHQITHEKHRKARIDPLYTPEGRPAPETLVRHSIVPLQRPSAQPVVTCGRLEALCSRHFSDTAPHVGHFFANRTALPVPRVSLPAPAAPRSAATCRRTAAGLDVLPPAGASSTWHAWLYPSFPKGVST